MATDASTLGTAAIGNRDGITASVNLPHGAVDVIKTDAIAQIRALDTDGSLLAELVTFFITDSATHLAEVRASVAAARRADAIRVLHTLKSSCGCLGAMRVLERTGGLEHRAREGGDLPSAEEISSLEAAVRDACAALTEICPAALPVADGQ
ncbi:MAG: Hpt domain-containing protein [Gemmatimonas sp.]